MRRYARAESEGGGVAHDDIVSSMVLELRRGTLVMLVLSQLREPAYGYALVKSLADHGIPVEANTLYPLMRRLESQGLLTSEWDNRSSKPRKYYRTTDEGLRVLREVEAQWHVLCDGVNALLRAGGDADAPRADVRQRGRGDDDGPR